MIMKDGGILPRVTVGEGFFFFWGGIWREIAREIGEEKEAS